MTTSTPFDLAAAFRSFPRRLREAMAPVAGDDEYAASIGVTALHDDVVKTINEVADIFGVKTSGRSLEDVVAETAKEIEGKPSKDWGKETLEQLQDKANHIGTALRQITKHIDEGQ
jgi:hypothetical protein